MMESFFDLFKEENILSITYRTGIFGASLILIGVAVSALFYVGRTDEPFTFRNHFVSELGEVGVSELAIVFNSGLFVGGLFLTVFLLGLAWLIKGWLGWVFAGLALITGISGTLVGAFPMNNLAPHITVAMLFFNTGQIMMLTFSVYLLFNKHAWFTKKLAIPGFVSTLFFVIFLNMPSSLDGAEDLEEATMNLLFNRPDVMPLAIFEWLIILSLMGWILITGFHLRRYMQKENSAGLT